MIGERAEQILEAVDGGEDFGVAAEAAGATVSEPKLISRRDPETDQLVVFEVFAAPKPAQDSPVTGRVRGLDGAYTVYSLEAVLPGRPESIPLEQRDAGKAELSQESGVGDYIAFLQSLYDMAMAGKTPLEDYVNLAADVAQRAVTLVRNDVPQGTTPSAAGGSPLLRKER